MEIKTVLKEQFKDLITEDTLTVLEEAFQQSVDEKVEAIKSQYSQKLADRTELLKESHANKISEIDEDHTEKLHRLVEAIDNDHTKKLRNLLESIDSDHSSKLRQLVESIDTDHTIKLQQIVEAIDKKHAKMLRMVVEKYEKALKGRAVDFRDRVVEEVSNYLDLYLDKVVPVDQISEAVENIRSRKQLDEIRRIVGINEEFISEEVKSAIIDGKQTIDNLRSSVQEAAKENKKLQERAERAEAAMLLAEHTEGMPEAKRFYVTKMLKNKTPRYIKENLQYVSQMFDKEQEQDVNDAKEELIQERTRARRMIDVPQEIITEQKISTNEIERSKPTGAGVSDYLIEMERLSRFSAKG
jgi:hypothetical protein